ncbi:MAG TPA: hypothetical protein VFH26_00135 [Gemmatimonadales bacterium]|nr:hypothetical protein [Gemmatimonadales bacterium]
MRPTLLAAMTIIGVILVPRGSSAQIRAEVGPYLGLYVPTASFGSAPFATPIPLPASTRHSTAGVVGAKAAIWLGSHIGLGLQVGKVSSSARTRDEGSREMEQAARITLGAVQLLVPLRIPSLQGRGHAHLSGGLGLIRRTGEFYETYDRVRNAAGIVGVGSDFAIAGPVNVTLDFEAYLYSLHLQQSGDTRFESDFQTDLLARVGLVLRLVSHDDDLN